MERKFITTISTIVNGDEIGEIDADVLNDVVMDALDFGGQIVDENTGDEREDLTISYHGTTKEVKDGEEE